MAARPLVGRDHEAGVLNDLIDRAPQRGGALVVRGDAGIGKSCLLGAASRRARERGMLVLSAAGVQSEAHLPFAGLHQLLRPILAGIGDLPAPQRAAIQAAFGITDAAAPDLFLIALATLNLIGESAQRAPVMLLVEDAHWLDRPTCDVMAFVARRLDSEPILLFAAIRDGFDSPPLDAGLPELHLDGLDPAAAGALLDARAPDLPPAVRARLLDEAAGNPLALVELPAAVAADDRGIGATLPAWLPLTTRLERAFSARVSALPPATRTLLLLLAVDDGGVLADVANAAARLLDEDTSPIEALEPAIAAGLVDSDEVAVGFCHPLMRSAIHQAASLSQRRSAHTALAAVLTGQPDRRAWHLAAASVGPNEGAGAALEEAATRARQRGAIAVAVDAFERAATLSVAADDRGRRLLRAAALAYELGRRDITARLLQEVEPLELGWRERARIMWLRETIAPRAADGATSIEPLVEAADHARTEGHGDLALDFLWLVASRCLWSDPAPAVRDSVVAAAYRLGSLGDDVRMPAILAYAAPVAQGRVVIEHLARLRPEAIADSEALSLLATAATMVGAFDLAAEYLAAAVARMRAHGRLGHLSRALVLQAWVATHRADWSIARPAAEEARRLALETGELVWAAGALAVTAMLEGLRGEEQTAETVAAEAEQAASPFGARFVLAAVQMARGVTALGAGRHADAYAHLRRLYDPADPAHHHSMKGRSIGDLTEAAVHCGRRDEARAIVEEMAHLAEQTPSPWFHVGLRHARPLLADDEDAEALFHAALDADLSRWPFDRARLLLAYGAWLRRQRRIAESRIPLRAARDAFDALGVQPWGERARQELRAAGEASRGHTPDVLDRLTPQEQQIARMAADGLSNREIGQRLYLSHRTVGSHLYRIFPKLGITARSELRTVLDAAILSPA